MQTVLGQRWYKKQRTHTFFRRGKKVPCIFLCTSKRLAQNSPIPGFNFFVGHIKSTEMKRKVWRLKYVGTMPLDMLAFAKHPEVIFLGPSFGTQMAIKKLERK